MVEYESLNRAWPKEPCILTRAKIGRRVENALAEIQRLQDTITGEAPVARDVVKEAHQDRREVRVPRSLHHLPACRGRDPENLVRRHPAPHRSAQAEATPNMTKALPFRQSDNGTGVSGVPPDRRYRSPPYPFGDQNEDTEPESVATVPASGRSGEIETSSTPSENFTRGIPYPYRQSPQFRTFSSHGRLKAARIIKLCLRQGRIIKPKRA